MWSVSDGRESERERTMGGESGIRQGHRVCGTSVNISPSTLDRIIEVKCPGSDSGKKTIDCGDGSSDGQYLVAVRPCHQLRGKGISCHCQSRHIGEITGQCQAGRV